MYILFRRLIRALLMLAIAVAFVGCDLFNTGFEVNLNVSPKGGKAPLKVEVAASASVGTQSFSFDPGDGSPVIKNSTGLFNYVYVEQGVYQLKVMVDSTDGQTKEAVTEIQVSGIEPIETKVSATPKTGRAPLKVEFDASSSKGALSFRFEPGDGSPPVNNDSGLFDHIYTEPGTYQAKVIVSGVGGLEKEAAVSIQVGAKAGLPDYLKQDVWTQIDPAAETICSDGTKYSYFVTPGKANKVVIDFQGGGACWDDYTCSRGQTGTYTTRIWVTPEILKTGDINGDGVRDAGGIYDREHPQNPVADWYHVYVSYCTGDVHWGNSVHTYTEIAGQLAGQDNVVHHRGAVNAQTVLDWVYDNFEAPDTIFVTGCSAGAYGAIMWTPHIARHYPNAKIHLLGDCGAGVVNQAFVDESLPRWNVEAGAWPIFIPALDPDKPVFELTANFINDIYAAIGNYLPKSRLSQFNTMGDGNQIFYYGLMNGDFEDTDGNGVMDVVPSEATIRDWLERMPQSMNTIAQKTDNFFSYLSMFDDNNDLTDGTGHCIIFRPEFYNLTESNVALVDWLDDFVSGRPVTSVKPAYVPPYDDITKVSTDRY